MTNTTDATLFDHSLLIGTRSHGDLRLTTLLATAADTADEFECITSAQRRAVDFYLEMDRIADGFLDPDITDRMCELAFDLQDALDRALPQGLYYGNLEGDASDIGVWAYDQPEDSDFGLEDD